MRYRALSATGDYTINVPFLANSPATVGQAVKTRLQLFLGEWYVDTSDGTPYLTKILGKHFGSNPNAYIKQRILSTPGVTSIVSYSSSINGANRIMSITTTINTTYSVNGDSSTTVSAG